MAVQEPFRTQEPRNDEVDATAVVRLLNGVEGLPERATGALVFGPPHRRAGTLLVEGRRVCWAAGAQMEKRLTDLLRRQFTPPISVETIERVYRRCLQDGTPLGEALVSSGLISAECLRTVLSQHTAEGIAALSRCKNLSPKWVPCLQRRYDPRFTFSTTELLARVGALLNETGAARAHTRLTAAVDGANLAVAFPWVENRRELLPISQVHGERVGVLALTELGHWAMDALNACDRLVAGCQVVVAASRAGQVINAWNDESVVYVVLCDGPLAMHRTLAKRLRMLNVAD